MQSYSSEKLQTFNMTQQQPAVAITKMHAIALAITE
jgi:hypothetical protein